MSRSFFVFVWLLHALPAAGQYSDQVLTWPKISLKLSPEVTIADLFTAGLRPFRQPYAQNTDLHAKHAHITLIDRDGAVFPTLPTDVLRTSVQKPGLIGTLEMWSPPLTINEARTEMSKWLPLVARTEEELDTFLAAVKKDWLHYDHGEGGSDTVRFAFSLWDADGLKKTVLLRKAWHWETPLRLCVMLETATMKSRRGFSFYDIPVPPPPGFEDADMKAPQNWDADNPYVPLTVEYRNPPGTLPPDYQLMNDQAGALAATQATAPSKDGNPQTGMAAGRDSAQKSAEVLWMWAGVALLTISILGYLRLKRKAVSRGRHQ